MSSEGSESKELYDKIDKILTHVRSMDGQMSWIIRSQRKELKKFLLNHFQKRRRAAKVYLAVDGNRTSGEIADYLQLLVQNVSNELSELEDGGLIELKKWGVYKKGRIDKILRLSTELRKDPEFKDIK